MPGYYRTVVRIKENATKIDNVTKFAYDDDDYETVQEWHEYTEEELAEIKVNEEAEAKRQKNEKFLETAPGDIDNLKQTQDTLVLAMASMIGA